MASSSRGAYLIASSSSVACAPLGDSVQDGGDEADFQDLEEASSVEHWESEGDEEEVRRAERLYVLWEAHVRSLPPAEGYRKYDTTPWQGRNLYLELNHEDALIAMGLPDDGSNRSESFLDARRGALAELDREVAGSAASRSVDELGQVAESAASRSVQPRAMWSDNNRPRPRRGDWVQALGQGGGHEIRFGASYTYVRPHQYLGPVHDVDDTPGFVSVCLPHPKTGQLAWMNIWSFTRGRGVHYARRVSNEELASWLRQGVRNEFQDLADRRTQDLDEWAARQREARERGGGPNQVPHAHRCPN